MWCSVMCCGSTHDSTAFTATQWYQDLCSNKLNKDYHIAADDVYVLSASLITPSYVTAYLSEAPHMSTFPKPCEQSLTANLNRKFLLE